MKRSQLPKATRMVLSILVLLHLLIRSEAVLKCPQTSGQIGTSWDEVAVRTVFDFGDPEVFVTSFAQEFHPYSLIDKHRRTAILHEYLMLGYKRKDKGHEVIEQLSLMLHDGISKSSNDYAEDPDVIHQNLENEMYWRYFNSTGVYPWLTIVNATTKKAIQFQAEIDTKGGKGNSYSATLVEREYFHEPQIPFDVVIEIPGNSGVLRKDKTIIQYQSFSLWRWKLSNKTAEWADVSATDIDESFNNRSTGDFKRIDNPCTKDMFLVFTARLSGSTKKLYLASPLIQSHLKENWFYDMTTDEHPWAPDTPTEMVLANDHFLVLTQSSLWVSESLNFTEDDEDLPMTKNHTERPSLKYFESNPCGGYNDTILCFTANNSEQRLFYNPVCYLYQVPLYDDYVTFMVKNSYGDENSFTVLYGAKPYGEWRILFHSVYYYRHYMKVDGVQMTKQYRIRDIVGLFFNHQSKYFDITIAVYENESSANKTSSGGKKDEDTMFIRFSLRETSSKGYAYGDVVEAIGDVDKKELDGVMGGGIAEFIFPNNFEVENVVVNGDTQDVFFIGNQLWIAEAGGEFVYQAVTGLSNDNDSRCSSGGGGNATRKFGRIRECSFNHPDRTFVCLNDKRTFLLAGKIASTYAPLVTLIDQIEEIHDAQEVNAWASSYVCKVIQKHSVFVAGYSGKILMWYMFDPQEVAKESGSIISNPDSDPVCQPQTKIERVCSNFKRFLVKGCTSMPVGEPQFRMLAIDPIKLEYRKLSSDGPLVPFLLDSNAAILFEGIVPDTPEQEADRYNYYGYFSEVDVGRKIYCNNYELVKTNANDPAEKYNCELYIQHIKPVEEFLDGFRSAVYAMVLKSVFMLPVPADLVVLVAESSNRALIKINDHINNPAWTFEDKHIGQTLYLPGEFSILLTGFPKPSSKSLMQGFTTRYLNHEYRVVFHAFFSFLIDMSTKTFHKAHKVIEAVTQKNYTDRLAEIDKRLEAEREKEVHVRKILEDKWKLNAASDPIYKFARLFAGNVPPYRKREEVENALLTVEDHERNIIFPANAPKGGVAGVTEPAVDDLQFGKVDYDQRVIWYSTESDCDYTITLAANPVLKSHGGRISLDLHDTITFEVHLRSLTRIGKLMMYRPLLVVTNSNPIILRVDMKERMMEDPQVIQLKLQPTGFQKGTAVLTLRSVMESMKCAHTTSITLIVLVHREVGRRLHINYPFPNCKPSGAHGMYPRRFSSDQSGCISRKELLNSNDSEVIRFRNGTRHVTHITLPPNYRPPSFDGSDIPVSKNIYNADPSKPPHNSWYQISRETFEYELCKGKKNKTECRCTDNDRLLDDEMFTECKEKVFYTARTGAETPLQMSAEYDRIMQDEDQDLGLFTSKKDWSVTIEEVNGRSEWFIVSPPSAYLTMINSREDLSEGMRHYDMKSFSVGLLGTGLYHFRVTLGRFESFDETTGYFILYVANSEFNHLQLFMILLGTIIFCMTLVFLGFIAARKRLSSMLPIQPMSHKRKLKLL